MLKILSLVIIFLFVFANSYSQSHTRLEQRANKLQEQGKVSKAEVVLSKIAESDTEQFIWLLNQSRQYFLSQSFDSAHIYLAYSINYSKNHNLNFDQEFLALKDSLYAFAISIYDNIILELQDGDHYCNRGLFKKDIGRYQEGLKDFTIAISIDPQEKMNYYNRALVNNDLGLIDSAVSDYTACIQLDSTYGSAYLNRGFIYMENEEYELAIDDFFRSITFSASKIETSYSYNNIGLAYVELECFPLAIKFVQKSIELNPLNPYAYRNMAIINGRLRNYSDACAFTDKAIEFGFVEKYGTEILDMKKKYCASRIDK
jgi:tetratricopeptide (TPR) repeat protein